MGWARRAGCDVDVVKRLRDGVRQVHAKPAAWGSAPRLFCLFAGGVAAWLLLAGGAAGANQAANIDQCANGKFGAPTTCPPAWQNGDLNSNNSFYREGDTVPFRVSLTGLTAGDHTLVIQFDTTKNGKHAYDYLTRYDRTVTSADPCDGGTLCSGSAATSGTIPLPADPQPTGSHVVSDANRYMSIWGGTISAVTLGGDSSDVAGQDQSMTIDFTATGDSAVIAWGGHVADEITWGPGSGAGSIPGSPYHMQLISLDGASAGQQDRQMQSNAVAPAVPTFTTNAVGNEDGQTVTDNALLTGSEANGPVTGTVSFFACYSADSTPDCSIGGDLVAADVAVSELGTASSGAYAPAHGAGTYCFRAEYSPDADAQYSPTVETNAIVNNNDGNNGECFTVAAAPTTQLTLDKVVTNNDGGTAQASDFTLTASPSDGQALSGAGPSAGPFDAAPGVSYALSESGPSGYTASAWSCDGGSQNGSSITLEAGDHVTCTITNDDVAPPPTTTTTTTTTTPPPAPAPAPAPPAPPSIDLAITKIGTPNPAVVGGTITWTETVKNNGPDAATGVNVADPLPPGVSFVSVAASQGSCTGGAVIACALGNLANGASATITLVTSAGNPGSITNTATVIGNEAESNRANNTASATVAVQGAFVPPKVKPAPQACTAVVVAPKSLLVGKRSQLTLRLSQAGKHAQGIRVRIQGARLSIITSRSNAKGVVKVRVRPQRPGIVRFAPVAHKGCATPRIGVIGAFTPPVTG